MFETNAKEKVVPKQQYIICLDSETFKFTKGLWYICIENFWNEPIQYQIKIHEKHEFDILDEKTQTKNKIYDDIFSQVNPSQVSHKERARLNLEFQIQYTYGEVEFRHFYPILSVADPKEGEVFWDIGWGACKPMIVAALCFPQLKCVKGVE